MIENIKNIEKKYLPFIEIIEQSSHYDKLYKGFITFQSKLNENPDILFLGINAGEGAFKEYKEKNLRRTILNEENVQNLKLDWFKEGNCRGEMLGSKWKAYQWYETTKKINNSFPARMVDLLILWAEKSNENKEIDKKQIIETVENEVHEKIIFTNLYPIATKTTNELNKILSMLVNETELLKNLGIEPNIKSLKNFFRQRTIDFINELNPKTIVFLGHTAYNELTLKTNYKGSRVLKDEIIFRKNDTKSYKTVSFSRQGNWSGLLNEVVNKILEN
jgi:hypothetical protein